MGVFPNRGENKKYLKPPPKNHLNYDVIFCLQVMT